MIKIDITKKQQEDFLNLVNSIFKNGKLEKRKDKKIVFSISQEGIDKLLRKKLGKFDKDITLNKLILYDLKTIKELIAFLNANKSYTKLNNNEKDIFLTLYSRLPRKEFVEKLKVTTCLYCNRNYIFNFTKNGQKETTAQLDHFFNKNKYPYLAVSLYNLVPCCPTCNQRKSTKETNVLHPYYKSFDKKAKFTLKIEDSTFYTSINGFKIDIETKDEEAKESIKVFNLKELYQNHKDIVLELIQKEVIYNESYMDELLSQYEGTLFKNKEDLQRLVSGGYVSDEEIGKRPLSKLIKDISEELGLL